MITGFGDMMQETFANINFTLFLAIVLIYMILAAQFESLVHPFTIMLSAPLSFIGAFLALIIADSSLDVLGQIAFLMFMLFFGGTPLPPASPLLASTQATLTRAD